jgi:hypothetical protein
MNLQNGGIKYVYDILRFSLISQRMVDQIPSPDKATVKFIYVFNRIHPVVLYQQNTIIVRL